MAGPQSVAWHESTVSPLWTQCGDLPSYDLLSSVQTCQGDNKLEGNWSDCEWSSAWKRSLSQEEEQSLWNHRPCPQEAASCEGPEPGHRWLHQQRAVGLWEPVPSAESSAAGGSQGEEAAGPKVGSCPQFGTVPSGILTEDITALLLPPDRESLDYDHTPLSFLQLHIYKSGPAQSGCG